MKKFHILLAPNDPTGGGGVITPPPAPSRVPADEILARYSGDAIRIAEKLSNAEQLELTNLITAVKSTFRSKIAASTTQTGAKFICSCLCSFQLTRL